MILGVTLRSQKEFIQESFMNFFGVSGIATAQILHAEHFLNTICRTEKQGTVNEFPIGLQVACFFAL